jgi:hypothetical protein
LEFDGGTYANSSGINLPITNNFTIIAIANVAQLPASSFLFATHRVYAAADPRVTFFTATNIEKGISSDYWLVNDKQFHLFVFTYNSTHMVMYISSFLEAIPELNGTVQTSTYLCIGSNFGSGNFRGIIDELWILSRSLTLEEVYNIFKWNSVSWWQIVDLPYYTKITRIEFKNVPSGVNVTYVATPIVTSSDFALYEGSTYGEFFNITYEIITTTNDIPQIFPLKIYYEDFSGAPQVVQASQKVADLVFVDQRLNITVDALSRATSTVMIYAFTYGIPHVVCIYDQPYILLPPKSDFDTNPDNCWYYDNVNNLIYIKATAVACGDILTTVDWNLSPITPQPTIIPLSILLMLLVILATGYTILRHKSQCSGERATRIEEKTEKEIWSTWLASPMSVL